MKPVLLTAIALLLGTLYITLGQVDANDNGDFTAE